MKVKFIMMDEECIALFPDIVADCNGNITSCAHAGQYSAAKRSLMRKKGATNGEYQPLLNELIVQGYDNLRVMNWKYKSHKKGE